VAQRAVRDAHIAEPLITYRPPRTFLVAFSLQAMALLSNAPKSTTSILPQSGQGYSLASFVVITAS
jgi:hypothetical protein